MNVQNNVSLENLGFWKSLLAHSIKVSSYEGAYFLSIPYGQSVFMLNNFDLPLL